MFAAHSMRKSAHSFSSICRSLKLLLILLLCFVKVSQGFPDFKIGNIADQLTGAESLEKESRLWNRCSNKFVQITRLGSKGVDAGGPKENDFSRLKIISIDGGFIRIRGMANNFYLCFNKKGKLRTRFQPPKSLPHSCDFSQNLTGDGYHTFKLRDKPDWSIGFKENGKKLPGFLRKESQKICHHFSLEPLDPMRITTPVDFDKLPLNYDFRKNQNRENKRNKKRKIRHKHRKNRKNRRRERRRKNSLNQKTLNVVNR